MNEAFSVAGIRIRLTDERWAHIAGEHGELAGMRDNVVATVSSPDAVFEGGFGELLAARQDDSGRWLVVVYREIANDGFIITAFLTRRYRSLSRRARIWP